MKPSILTKLAQLSDRLDEVTGLLGDPDVTRDMDAYRRLTREHAELTPVVEQYLVWRQTEGHRVQPDRVVGRKRRQAK